MTHILLSPSLLKVMVTLSCLLSGVVAVGQEQPAATQPTTAPAEREPVLATVIDVHGDAQHRPLQAEQWQPCQVGDEYPQQTVIRTGIRSSLKLQIGDEEPYTAVLIESASKTILSEAYKTRDTKRIRIGVGYGRIRAGVAEGGLKSDFTVDSPVATLSKRGTWNFGLFYERATDRFEVFLLDQGLVEAFDKVAGVRRELLPREAVTQTMRRWLDEAQIRRNVPIPDILGQGEIEIAFNRLRQDGLGVLDAAGGRAVLIDLSTSFAQQEFSRLLTTRVPVVPPAPRISRGPFVRPEGFFGTGRGDQLIDVVIEANNPLSQKGLARPGTYKFRRSVAEDWLRKCRGKP